MDICYQALAAEDATLRGTALEYLENRLPQDVRTALWPLIASGYVASKSKRSTREIQRDLRKALPSMKAREQKGDEV